MEPNESNPGYFGDSEPNRKAIERDNRIAALKNKITALKRFEATGDYYLDLTQVMTIVDKKILTREYFTVDQLRSTITGVQEELDRQIHTILQRQGLQGAGPGSTEESLHLDLMYAERDALSAILSRETVVANSPSDAEVPSNEDSGNELNFETVKEWGRGQLRENGLRFIDLTDDLDRLRRRSSQLLREAIGIAQGLEDKSLISSQLRHVSENSPLITGVVKISTDESLRRLSEIEEEQERNSEQIARINEEMEHLRQNIEDFRSK